MGLDFPLIDNSNPPGTEKCYLFTAPGGFGPGHGAANPFCAALVVVNGLLVAPGIGVLPPSNCTITASGILKAVVPFVVPFDEPHCGISESSGGKDTAVITMVGGPKTVALSNLGWFTTAGSVLPVTGNWDAADPTKAKGERKFVMLVQPSGTTKATGQSLALPCLAPKGADAFDVNAVAVLLRVFSSALPTPVNLLLKHPKKP